MGALLLKDVLSLKKSILTYVGFLVLYTIIGIYAGNNGFFLALALVVCIMMPVSALAVDEQCHWDRMAVCMPVKRGAVVISKYILALIALFCALLPAVLLLVVQTWSTLPVLEISMQEIFVMGIMGVIITALQIPFLIWLGVEKGRFVSMGSVFLLCFGVPVLVSRSGLLSHGSERFLEHILGSMTDVMRPGLWLLMLAAFAILAVSAAISVHIYNKKEII